MKVLWRLSPYFKGQGWLLMWGFAGMMLQNIGLTLMPQSIQAILDELLAENRSSVVSFEALKVLGLMLVSGFGMYLMRKLIISVSRDMEYALRRDLFAKLGRLDFAFFQKHPTGDLISRCTNDLDHVRVLLGPGIMYIPNSVSRLLLFSPVLLALDPVMTAMVMGQMLVLMILIVLFMPRMKPLHTSLQEQVGLLNSRVWQILNSLTMLRLYRRESKEMERFDELNQEYIRRNLRLEKFQAFLWPFFQTLFALSEVIILAWGGLQVIEGHLSLGELLQFKVMVSVLAFPVLSLGWVMSAIQQGVSAMERILMIFDEPEVSSIESVNPPSSHASGKGGYDLECRSLTFSYPNATITVLKDINFTLKSGETVGITGPVGCGKSTLLNLLVGVLQPPEKCMFMGGEDLRAWEPERHHALMSYVPQDAFLFSRKIWENIALSNGDSGDLSPTTQSRVEEAAREASLHEDIVAFPRAYEEWVGEKGVTLSGGQCQRTSLARALFKEAPWLILDDALSAVDAETESKILDSIRKRGEGQSMLIVSHRISALRHADRILVMQNGRIVDEGRHEELMERDGLYSHLAQLQQMDEVLSQKDSTLDHLGAEHE